MEWAGEEVIKGRFTEVFVVVYEHVGKLVVVMEMMLHASVLSFPCCIVAKLGECRSIFRESV